MKRRSLPAIAAAVLLGTAVVSCGGDRTAGVEVRQEGFAAVITPGGDAYLFGGTIGDRETRSALHFPPEGSGWSRIASLPEGRSSIAGATTAEGHVYAIGGDLRLAGSTDSLSSIEVYRPRARFWRELPAMPTAREDAAAAVGVDGRIYVVGGLRIQSTNASGPSAAAEAYDPKTNRWTRIAHLPVPRWGAAAVALGRRMYVVGGGVPCDTCEFGDTEVDDVSVLDVGRGVWHPAPRLPVAQEDIAAFAARGSIYVLGFRPPCFTSCPALRTVYRLTPGAAGWERAPQLSTAPQGGVAAARWDAGTLVLIDWSGRRLSMPYPISPA